MEDPGMDTETPVKDPEPSESQQEFLEVQPIDPLKDIDGRLTALWIGGFVVAIFSSMWLLWLLFAFVLENEQRKKVDDRPPMELQELRAWEASELLKARDLGDGTEQISIDEAIKRLAK